MPIAVACSCGVKLRAPDAAAGKRVKCPKCGNPVSVPAPAPEADFEVVDDDPPAAAAPAKKKPKLVDDDPPPATKKVPAAAKSKPKPVEVDEAVDDEDEDEKPKKKGKGKGKKKKEEPKSKLPLILGIGGGVVGLLVIVGIVVAVMMGGDGGQAKGTQSTQSQGPSLPAGWSMFKGEGFSVAVPDASGFKKLDQPPNAGGIGGPGAGGGNTYTNAKPGQQQQPEWVYMVAGEQLPEAQLNVFRQDPNAAWEQMKKLFSLGGAKVEMTPFTAGGAEGREFVVGSDTQKMYGIMRIVIKDNRQHLWGVISKDNPPTAGDPNVKPFFDTFKFE